MTKKISLDGIALSNFKGIGENIIFLAPFKQFNFFIGENNSGKSSVLVGISKYLHQQTNFQNHSRQQEINFDPIDINFDASGQLPVFGIGSPTAKILSTFTEISGIQSHHLDLIKKILNAFSVMSFNWIGWDANKNKKKFISAIENMNLKALDSEQGWYSLWGTLTQRSGGSIDQHWIPETVDFIVSKSVISYPSKVTLIPAIREISPKGRVFENWDGSGLIEKLAQLQNPDVHERGLTKKFYAINHFLQTVTDNETARIEIPHSLDHVLINMDRKTLPLTSLGTGIHEVVMLASFCTLLENQILCIEEPEIHLHPVLQRRFIDYLKDNTSNQYFIATHSPAIIDTEDASIFHVTNKNGETFIGNVSSSNERFEVCHELGYKASDLLQANAIIWVEGPSDRIYIRHWITSLDSSLREGIHYSIMFYGGRLLSHLDADDANEGDIQALIAVRNLNRNLIIVIDSDKKNKRSEINATKKRIQAEITKHKFGLCWITQGREIENYVDTKLMSESLQKTYPSYSDRYQVKQFEHVLPFKNKDDKIVREIDKVKIAKAVCQKEASLDVLDLKERVEEIVEFIKKANK